MYEWGLLGRLAAAVQDGPGDEGHDLAPHGGVLYGVRSESPSATL